MKTYVVLGLIILTLLMGTYLSLKEMKHQKDEAERWRNNYTEQVAYNKQNTEVIFKFKEFKVLMSDSIETLLKQLEIPPRTIVKVVEKVNRIHDTIEVPVEVSFLGNKEWKLKDEGKCWLWEGQLKFEVDTPIVKRIGFDYHNKTTDIFSRQLKFKFLFIRIYSKKDIIQKSISECGESTSRTIVVTKN